MFDVYMAEDYAATGWATVSYANEPDPVGGTVVIENPPGDKTVANVAIPVARKHIETTGFYVLNKYDDRMQLIC